MPTENRSSNTEMVSVPPYIGLEPLAGRYYPAQCRRCGWVGSSEELTEDDAQCTRDIGDRLCLGDCDELERHDLLNIIQAMAAPQPHPEPIAWMVGTAIWWTKEEAERDAAATGLPVVGVGPMTDSGEVERLHAEVKALTHTSVKEEVFAVVCKERDSLRAKLDQAHGVLRLIPRRATMYDSQIDAALSASEEPSAPIAWHVGGNGYDRICFEQPTDLPGRPCIHAIHDQRQLINLLKRYDLRNEDVPPDERAHGIPGTSFQRLNALANHGE